MNLLVAFTLGLLPIVVAAVAWRRSRATDDIPKLRAVSVLVASYVLGWVCLFAEFGLWEWTGLSVVARPGYEWEAVLAIFLFAAPLEEGAKVLCIWPLYSGRRLSSVRHGVMLSALAGAG